MSATAAMMAQFMKKDLTNEEDPRDALLKYADGAQQNPVFFGEAYKKTQPKPIFQQETDELDEKVQKITAQRRFT